MLQSLKLAAEPLTDSILRIRLTDANSKRWEVPTWLFRTSLLPGGGGGPDSSQAAGKAAAQPGEAGPAAADRPDAPASGSGSSSGASPQNNQQFKLELREAPFGIEVSRLGGSRATVFNTTGTRLVYKASGEWCFSLPCVPFL